MARIFRRRGADGEWIKTWYAWIPDVDAGGVKRVSTRCTDKVAAQKRADELEREAADPDSAAQAKASLKDALELLIRDRTSLVTAGKRSMETVEFYRKKGGILLGVVPTLLDLDEGAPVSLRDVGGPLVDDYIVERREHGAKETTIAKELTTWRAAMRLAKRRRLWKGDLEETFPKFSAEYRPRERFLQPHEVLPLRDAFIRPTKYRGGSEGPEQGHALWAICAFIVATSAENAAVWRARPEDIDVSDPEQWSVHVRGSKNDARDRIVPIVHLPFALLLLEVLRYADGDHGLFLDREGSFRHRLGEACERAGIPHLSPTDLRRTHAKWLRLAGVAPTTFYPAMGHADSRMAERVYAKTSPQELAAVMRAELIAHGGIHVVGEASKTAQTERLLTAPQPEKKR